MKKGPSDMLDVLAPPRGSHSQIPVITPRQSSLPSSLSSSHLGLVPPSRHLSVSGSPTHPSPTSSSSSGGSTPFRSFRNLLQFGPSKTPNATSNPTKSPFGGFSSLRRSMNGERSVSTPHLRRERSYEDSPVLAIDLPHGPLMGRMEFQTDSSLHVTHTQPVFSRPSPTQTTKSEAPGAEPPSDLSTILESDTSGISKHIPALDDSRDDEHAPFGSFGPTSGSKVSRTSGSQPNRLGRHDPSRDNSALDLSTSKVTNEVMAAMSEAGVKDGWLNGVVVDLSTENAAGEEVVHDIFNLSALDPDLAALLSPNRVAGAEPAVLVAINSLPSPPLPSPTRSDVVSASSRAGSLRRTPVSTRTSPVLAPSAFKGSSANLPSTAEPRLIRSVSDRPTPRTSQGLAPPTLGRTPSHSPERPSGLREQQGSSLLSEREHPPRRPRTGDASEPRPGITRLTTPSRLVIARNARNQAGPPSTWEGDSFTPSSRPSSSAGIAQSRPASSTGTAPSRLQQVRSARDGGRPTRLRARDRSASVVEEKHRASLDEYHPKSVRPSAEWLGPRTVKAFAAAGLLDFDKDGNSGSASRAPSRLGASRSSIDRDTRSRQTPSRMAHSEAGSGSSWGRRSGSISHAFAASDTTSRPQSETVSTPRTTFSAGSTAATSISASFMHNQHVESEVQQLQDKHALETGALLNALADSQRTTKLLRDENTQLRDRLQHLEDRLNDAHEQLRRMQYTPPSQPVLAPKSSYQRFTDSIPLRGSNGTVPSRLRSFLRPGRDSSYSTTGSPESLNASSGTPLDMPTFTEPHYKRTSAASSLFHGPPSNMSMIMHEDGIPTGHSPSVSLRSISPSSPTLVLAKIGGGKGSHGSHEHHHSIGSVGNISPTTANFSFITGSPGSLHLRPEHERHLGDMPSLDLRSGAEDDEYDDGAS